MHEDLSGATVEPAVLGLQDRDVVGAGQGLELPAVLGPRFNLPGDEIDPELRQHLAHRG